MPETIAVYKLRGFVHDADGEVVESVPGLIRVRLGGRGSLYGAASKDRWLVAGPGTQLHGLIDVELRWSAAQPRPAEPAADHGR